VGEFLFDGHTLFIIANHFNSKGGGQPLFGHHQPPARPSETQRRQQAQVVSDFVQAILARDPNANVVVLGDLNDFEFSDTLGILKSAGLTDIVETLPPEERYTYVFEGNSQVLDHILISSNLVQNAAVEYDVVHVNAEFAEQVSDHDPEVARIRF
jgi:predicted extracellular nuclease